jgi:hypothetical protein
MRTRLLTLSVTLALALAAPPPLFPAQKPLTAQLGFIALCKTSMSGVIARLGSGALVGPAWPPEVTRGWYDAAGRAYLFVVRRSDEFHKGLPGAPPVIGVELATERHKPDRQIRLTTLGRPRLSLLSLQGPNGIRVGDSRERVGKLLGKPVEISTRGNVETYYYIDVRSPLRREGCAVAGFILQVSFIDGRASRIWMIEAS